MKNPIENPIAYVVNPGGSKMAKRKRKRHHRRNTFTYSNRGHKRRRHHRRHHDNPRRRRHRRNTFTYSNPVTIATTGLKKLGAVALPAAAGSFLVNFAESKFYPGLHPVIRGLIKTGVAVGGGAVLRRSPDAAAAWMGAVVGTMGGELGTRAGGGLVAVSAKTGMKELAEMAAEDGDLALIMKEELKGYGLGLVLEERMSGDEEMGDDVDGMGQDADVDGMAADDDAN